MTVVVSRRRRFAILGLLTKSHCHAYNGHRIVIHDVVTCPGLAPCRWAVNARPTRLTVDSHGFYDTVAACATSEGYKGPMVGDLFDLEMNNIEFPAYASYNSVLSSATDVVLKVNFKADDMQDEEERRFRCFKSRRPRGPSTAHERTWRKRRT